MFLNHQDQDPQPSCLGGTVSSPPLAAFACAAAGVTGVTAGRPLSLACEPWLWARLDPGVPGLPTTALLMSPAGLLTGVRVFTSVRMSSVQDEKALGLFTEDRVPSAVLIKKYFLRTAPCSFRLKNDVSRYDSETGIEIWLPTKKMYSWTLLFYGIIRLIRTFFSVPEPWHFGVDPDPRIHAFD